MTPPGRGAIVNNMVNYSAPALDATFSALADPTRRAILARLAMGDATVTELARPFQVSLPAISRHLRVLEEAGLMARDRQGRTHRGRLAAGPLHAATDWLLFYRGFWEGTFDALAEYLASGAQPEADQGGPAHPARPARPGRPGGPC